MLRSATRAGAALRPLRRCFSDVELEPLPEKKRILITGALGQIGSEFTRMLRERHGADNVVATDVMRPPEEFRQAGPFTYCDVLDYNQMAQHIVSWNVSWVVHFASILSAKGERNPALALKVNVLGSHNVLQCCKEYNLRVFAPSTIAAFGPSSPKDNTPNVTVMDPKTMYGVTKVHLELLGKYYRDRFGVDFRSVRYPGIISSETLPGGGTTDYAVEIFYDAIRNNSYTCYLKPDTAMPMMYMPDCLRGSMELLEAPEDRLHSTTYNITATSFSPQELAEEIAKVKPGFQIQYAPDWRQEIADGWPRSIDDSEARKDWGWQHKYETKEMVADMLDKIAKKIEREDKNRRK